MRIGKHRKLYSLNTFPHNTFMGKVFELISSIFCVYKHQSTVLFARFIREGKQVLIWRCRSLNCVTSEVESINLMNMPTLKLFVMRKVLRSVQWKLSYGIPNWGKLICKCDKNKATSFRAEKCLLWRNMILHSNLITWAAQKDIQRAREHAFGAEKRNTF